LRAIYAQDNSAEHHIIIERAQHVVTSQRRRICRLPEVAGWQGKGKRLCKYYQVISP